MLTTMTRIVVMFLVYFLTVCILTDVYCQRAVDAPQCEHKKPKKCRELNISHGNVCYSSEKHPQTANVTCDNGYYLVGDPIITCIQNTRWSSIPSCHVRETTASSLTATPSSSETPATTKTTTIANDLSTAMNGSIESSSVSTTLQQSTLTSDHVTSSQETVSTRPDSSSRSTTTYAAIKTTMSAASKETVTPATTFNGTSTKALPLSGEQNQGDALTAVYVSVPLLLVALVVSAIVFLLLRRRQKRKQRESDHQRNGNARTRQLTPAISNKSYTARPLGRQSSKEINGRIPEQGYAEINLDFEEETEYNTINVEAMDPLNPEEYGHLNTSNGQFIDTTYNHIEATDGRKKLTGTVDTYAHIKNSAVTDTRGKTSTNQNKDYNGNSYADKPNGVTKAGPKDSTYNTIQTTAQQHYDRKPAQLQVSCVSSDYGEYNHTFARQTDTSDHQNENMESSCDATYNHATDAIKTDNKHVLEEPDEYSHINTRSKTNTNPLDSKTNDEARSGGKKGMFRYDYAKVLKNVFTRKRSGGSRLDKQKNMPSTSEHINGTYNPANIDTEAEDRHYFILEKQETHPEENAADDRHYFILEKQDGHAKEDENHDNYGYLILKDE